MTRPDAVLDGWRDWPLPLTHRPRVQGEVPGGRTNRTFRLAGPGLGHDLLLRINCPDPGRLGIDRERERDIVVRTAEAGLSRPFLHWDPAHRFVVFPWLDGQPWTGRDLFDRAQRDRLWPLLERLGEIELDHPRRSYAEYLRAYLGRLASAGRLDARLDRAWRDFEPRLEAFDGAPWPARLVHHDLVPANILDLGDSLILIDWEYAAPGHPDIDRWSVEPETVGEPFIAELMTWINRLWERLVVA
ncbi:phosphotransferase [Wenzhouxiangella sp. XN79A]|uniref:phosphotransferase n=1 Tax=Wenzhouxiangella sp. XN79A TaxID=2724193 RepID=UPI00144AE4D2|nr:phosphotransferase [Wenzhouxiangella sp. XN79A]